MRGNIGYSVCVALMRPMSSKVGLDPTPLNMSFSVDSDTCELSAARQQLRDWFERNALPLHHWDVVLTELLVNAMNAGDTGTTVTATIYRTQSRMEIDHSDAWVVCEVSNQGTWFISGGASWADGEAIPLDFLVARRTLDELPNGRGLTIVSALTSGGEVTLTQDQTIVRVWLEV